MNDSKVREVISGLKSTTAEESNRGQKDNDQMNNEKTGAVEGKKVKHRDTRQRQLVLEEVTSRCDHPTADQIYLAVREKDSRISRGTVYRNLSGLAESGAIIHVKVPGADRYDLRTDFHYHMICLGCGSVEDMPVEYMEELDRRASEGSGCRVLRHRMIFEGYCAKCAAKSAED